MRSRAVRAFCLRADRLISAQERWITLSFT
jgi:hypothetical protein